MPGHTIPLLSITSEINRMAKDAFDRDNFFILVGEQLSALLEDIEFTDLPRTELLPKAGDAILPLVTFFQYIEELTDIQVADAIRTRIDWKFALHIPAITAEFQWGELCGFRQRFISDSVNRKEYQKLVDRLLKLSPPMKNKSSHVDTLNMLVYICSLNRLSKAEEAMSQTLECLASRFPEWLRLIALPHWYVRYHRNFAESVQLPRDGLEIAMTNIGADIHELLHAVNLSDNKEINNLQEIVKLNEFWNKQFENPIWTANLKFADMSEKNCPTCINNSRR
jgi:transposase